MDGGRDGGREGGREGREGVRMGGWDGMERRRKIISLCEFGKIRTQENSLCENAHG